MYQSPLHGIHGSETLPPSSARRLCSMLLALRVNNTILPVLLNAQARLRCGDLANIPQVRPPIPGAFSCQQHLSTCRYRPQSRASHGGQHPRLCSHKGPLRWRACITHAFSVCASRSRPACSRNSQSAHACGMEQHEILDAMHETIARSYLDLEIVLEDFMFVLLSIRFYIRIVAFCMVLMTLFAFAAFLQTLPSVFQTEDFLTASLLRAHQHAATLHAG